MHLIDGKILAMRIQDELKEKIKQDHLSPCLATLLIGDNPASKLYISLKKKAANEIGVHMIIKEFPADISDNEILRIIEEWNNDTSIHGILIQLPLSKHHDTDQLIQSIHPSKDVDGFHLENLKNLINGSPRFIPPVHEGILHLINETPLKLSGSSAVLLINSETFADPLKRLLKTAGMSINIMYPDDLDMALLQNADLIVIAVGRARFLHASQTKNDVVIIDVGINQEDGKVVGDVDRDSFAYSQAWISSVPGGVGPMTIANLLKNVVLASS